MKRSTNALLGRTKCVLAFILALVIFFVYFLMGRTSLVQGINEDTDQLKKSTLEKMYRKETVEGTILDANGIVLSEGKEPGKEGVLTYPEAYSWLLGYNSPVYGTYGLRGKYESYLFMQDEAKKGADIRLTIDHEIQEKAFHLIRGMNASMIVMDAKTGKLLALASARPEEFNANELAEGMETWNQIDGYFLPNGYKDLAEPGSTFKVVTAAAMLENNMEDREILDEGEAMLENHPVVNFRKKALGKTDLEKALGRSSNIYFASMALEMGGEALESKMQDFLIGSPLKLDFTTLESYYDLGNYDKNLIMDAGFGQGKTLMTPLHTAMILQSIDNKGSMMRPYMIDTITLGNEELYKGTPEKIGEPLTRQEAAQLGKLLKTTAEEYYGMDKYGIGAKSGTAEISGGMTKSYLAACNEDYVVVAAKTAADGFGADFKETVLEMYDWLYESERCSGRGNTNMIK